MKELNIEGTIVVADALHCQKETAEIIIDGKGDYLFSVKDNHPNLKSDIEDYVQDSDLLSAMKTAVKKEKNRDRIETRTAFVTTDIEWLNQRKDWKNLCCIGAIHTEFETKKGKSSEWHYYISSYPLSPELLLHHARMEWGVETMHWLLDMRFDEDWCRVEDRAIQENLNILRKFVLNIIKHFKSNTASRKAISKIMLDCLLNPSDILKVINYAVSKN